jgi:hypothetical protein
VRNDGRPDANGHIIANLNSFRVKLVYVNVLTDPDIFADFNPAQPVKPGTKAEASWNKIG